MTQGFLKGRVYPVKRSLRLKHRPLRGSPQFVRDEFLMCIGLIQLGGPQQILAEFG